MRDGWVPPSRSRRAPTEPSQSRESDETVREEPPQEPPTGGSAGSQSRNVRPIHKHLQEVRISSSDDGDFLLLEERTSFEEDMAPQEPLVQQELQGAQGGQDVALRGPQPSYWRLIRPPVDPALKPPARGSAEENHKELHAES